MATTETASTHPLHQPLKIAVTAACILASPAAYAGFFNGNEAYTLLCRTGNASMYVAGLNDGYLLGAHKMVFLRRIATPLGATVPPILSRLIEHEANDTLPLYCAPEGVTAGQMADVFCAYLKNDPKDRQMSAAILFRHAMTEAWPCPAE